MTNNPRESSYLRHLEEEAQRQWSKQLRSGAFGDLMKREEDIRCGDCKEFVSAELKRCPVCFKKLEDDWRPDIDELIAEKESKDENSQGSF
ncbi:MAG TPA: hypothetical protein VI358_18150 [Pseudolabrys sp.]